MRKDKQVQTNGGLQSKTSKAKNKRVWKPTGKIFSVDEIFSEIQIDVLVSQVFSRLKEGLVVCDRDEFLWDEDPDVRRMLTLVFNEEDTGEGPQYHAETSWEGGAPVVCHTSTAKGQVDVVSQNHIDVSREDASVKEHVATQGQVGNVSSDQVITTVVDSGRRNSCDIAVTCK